MFDQFIFILLFIVMIELYFATKAIFFLSLSFIYVAIVSCFAIKYKMDLLFLTLIIVAISAVLTLTIVLFSLYNKAECTFSNIIQNFNSYLFLFFLLITSTIFVTTNDIIPYKWVSYFSLQNGITYQVTHLLHKFVMHFFIVESSLINVVIFVGLLSSLNIISVVYSYLKERSFKKIGVNLKLKRLSRRLNTFSSFIRK